MTTDVSPTTVVEMSKEELDRLIDRVKGRVAPEDARLLAAILGSYDRVTELLRDKQMTIARLRQLCFGSTSEKTEKVLGKDAAPGGGEAKAGEKPRPKAPGHGRRGARSYRGATRVPVKHGSLKPGDPCPECQGKVHAKPPVCLVRIRAVAPILATVYEQERLRCHTCGEVFTARAPEGVGEEKYDATVPSMIGVLRYGSGLPLHRIEDLQEAQGVPLSASTQWGLLSEAAEKIAPAHEELRREAAQGKVLHNDDTSMVILDVLKERKARRERGEEPEERTGVFTTGIVSLGEEQKIILFATGRRHAGENLSDLLQHRDPALEAPVQMCDGLDRNLPEGARTVLANCVVHGRRQFVDVVGSFPSQVRHVLEELRIVYRADAQAKAEHLSDDERLRLHQEKSAPVMAALKTWMESQIAERQTEPNSGLGKAIAYALKRWEPMTLFLRRAGAPLDNNLCESVLKRAILHRKNSLFYKTQNGARVGDIFMSLVATARATGADPFDYLTELQRNATRLATAPAEWMPWNYRATLARLRAPGPGP